MIRLSGEGRNWLIGGAACVAAWVLALGLVRYQIGPMDNPDDFSPFPPPSALIAALLLGPATAVFVVLAVSRLVVLGLGRFSRRRDADPGTR